LDRAAGRGGGAPGLSASPSAAPLPADDRSSTADARAPPHPVSWPSSTRVPGGPTMSYPPQYGAQQPQYGTAQPAYGAGPGQYVVLQVEPPGVLRCLLRLCFGHLVLLANVFGLVDVRFVASIGVAVVALLGAPPATMGGASGTVDASSTALTLVYVAPTE